MGAKPEPDVHTLHGTAIAVAGYAALIRGAAGAGKSDLALRCLALPPWRGPGAKVELVADDQVIVTWDGPDVRVGCPQSIFGLLEVRGLGIVTVPAAITAKLVVVIDLVAAAYPIERLPEPETTHIFGVAMPIIRLHPFEASAPNKLLIALHSHGYGMAYVTL